MVIDVVCGQDQLPTVTNKVYNAVAKLWKPWLDEEAIHTLRKGKWKIYSFLFLPLILFMLFRLRSLMFICVCQFWNACVPRFFGGHKSCWGEAWRVSGPRVNEARPRSQWPAMTVDSWVFHHYWFIGEWGYVFKLHPDGDCSSSGLSPISSVILGMIHVCFFL